MYFYLTIIIYYPYIHTKVRVGVNVGQNGLRSASELVGLCYSPPSPCVEALKRALKAMHEGRKKIEEKLDRERY